MINSRIAGLLSRMDELQASDVFLTTGRKPYVRIFGEMRELDEEVIGEDDLRSFFTDSLLPGVCERLERERDLDIGVSMEDDRRYRLNIFYQKGMLSLVARRVPIGALSFAELGVPKLVREFAEKARGLVLITGATGSGKSSTMAAMLHHINTTAKKHIVTIEDPIEYLHRDGMSMVTQREVGSDTLSFSDALKHVVRQSPDVIFIGEMRDLDTIQVALSAAMTGHLVVSTMHTVDVSQTLERIINYFPDHLRDQIAMDLSVALVGIVSQRLLPRADGKGQVPATETLVATPLARRLIATRQIDEIIEVVKGGAADGMSSFTRTLSELVKHGTITVEVGTAAATNREEFLLSIQGMETGIDSLRSTGDESETYSLNMKSLLKAAVRHDASDLIVTVGSPPVLRIAGDLRQLHLPTLTSRDTQRLLFSVLNPAQRARFEQEKELDFALSVTNLEGLAQVEELKHSRFRVNGFYQKGSIAIALRVITQVIPNAQQIGIPAIVLDMAKKHQGLVLVTGPTGHGKSTTLACIIDIINASRGCHIITVEDPIEFVHKNKTAVVEQREVYADTRSFASALKYVLRQDPDVILIGEMRDQETISAALTAAETGHLVFATLHTNDAAQTVDRIIDTFPPHQQNQVRAQLASALVAVVAQRLLPRADGKGRVACFEIMLATTAIQSLIREARTHQIPATIETSAKDGMVTMDKALKNLYNKNLISRATVQSISRDVNLV